MNLVPTSDLVVQSSWSPNYCEREKRALSLVSTAATWKCPHKGHSQLYLSFPWSPWSLLDALQTYHSNRNVSRQIGKTHGNGWLTNVGSREPRTRAHKDLPHRVVFFRGWCATKRQTHTTPNFALAMLVVDLVGGAWISQSEHGWLERGAQWNTKWPFPTPKARVLFARLDRCKGVIRPLIDILDNSTWAIRTGAFGWKEGNFLFRDLSTLVARRRLAR